MSAELLHWPPAGFEMWSPFTQAAGLFLSTFVLEDVAAVGAGLLLASGALAWTPAFAACFLGIWIGDAGLYALARVVGRNCFERTLLRRFSSRVAQSERWFAERGNWILVFSRLLPGARLPTYLAAGFLRLPADRFLLITGAASLVWTVFVLAAVQALGGSVLVWLAPFRRTGWTLLAGAALFLLTRQLVKRLLVSADLALAFRFPKRFGVAVSRARRWEFWPPWLFYAPVALHYLWLAIKYRGLTLPTAANPGIFSGGIIGESKMAVLRQLMDTSPEFVAEAELAAGSTPTERFASIHEICRRRGIDYPFILKPDIGQRGAGVKLVASEAQVRAYLERTSAPLLVQRFAPGPGEAGIFHYRHPQEPNGHIFAITEKIFPVLAGDGGSTVEELVWADPRARFLAAKYLERLKDRRREVLAPGETLKLVEAGNHAQGCIFRDGMRLCSPELAGRIDRISAKLCGFYIGRYDVRYSTEADLRAGKNFQIVELNGAAAEATSIYDARNSLGSAYRTLRRQWDLVFQIGAANRRMGCPSTKLSVLWRKWREYARLASTYPVAD